MRKHLTIALLVGLGGAGPAAAAPPANTLVEMYAELRGCLTHVSMEQGAEVTIQFSLNRRGGLIEWGKLALVEDAGDRQIGMSFYARWAA